ncbi:lipid A deacylase LpxR family protein [Spirosoma flavum]|uniref:Lipid A deacylase LpxR family protein n=1 Tax=Spirosoma flavum TaxID=2048557 RepID=A0ABW6APS3_9BACT
MQKIKPFLALLGSLVSGLGLAQRIDNTASFRQIGQGNFIRLHYDNDFFTATDYYYTQGYNLEVVNPALRKNPLTKLLVKATGNQVQYGLAFEHFGFTPTSIQSNAILIGDRPFAGCILLKTFSISTDTLRRIRVSSQLSTGMIGPVAFGGEIQAALHRLTNGIEPHGWQHQIRNDVILNYALTYEKQLYTYRHALSVSATAQAQVGTFADRLQTGVVVMAGRFNSPFGPTPTNRQLPLQLYVYAQPLVSVVAYDASLQGGLFNRSSPYVITADQLTRTTFQANVGAVFSYKNLYLEYYQSVLSREFETGLAHRWGGVKIGISFNPFSH